MTVWYNFFRLYIKKKQIIYVKFIINICTKSVLFIKKKSKNEIIVNCFCFSLSIECFPLLLLFDSNLLLDNK